MADLYGSAELAALVPFVKPRPFYALERWFTGSFATEKDEIIFDDVFDDVRIAPFVIPTADGKPVVHQGARTRSFKPAYIKLRDPITIAQVSDRQPGEEINSAGNRLSRLDQARVKRMGQHRRSVLTRLEWMSWQYARNGLYTVSGESYPTKVLDFGRDPGNTVTLAGAALWSALTTAKPLTDWQNWSKQILEKGFVGARLLTMSPEAWNACSETTQFRDEYKNFRSNGGPVPNTSPALAEYIQYKGEYGSFIIEVVNTSYLDESGVEQRYLPANEVIMSAPGQDALGGMKLFGKIEHMRAVKEGVGATDMYQYEWTDDEGSAHNIGLHSAPLIAAARPNAFLKAQVL